MMYVQYEAKYCTYCHLSLIGHDFPQPDPTLRDTQKRGPRLDQVKSSHLPPTNRKPHPDPVMARIPFGRSPEVLAWSGPAVFPPSALTGEWEWEWEWEWGWDEPRPDLEPACSARITQAVCGEQTNHK